MSNNLVTTVLGKESSKFCVLSLLSLNYLRVVAGLFVVGWTPGFVLLPLILGFLVSLTFMCLKMALSPVSSPLLNWNLHLWRNLTEPEIQEFADLSDILHQFQPSPSNCDSRIWTISPSGTFTVSSFFSAISSSPFTPPFLFKPSLSFQSSRISSEISLESWAYFRYYPVLLPSPNPPTQFLPPLSISWSI